jgi:trk system potassium uptake protein TrkH
MKIRIVLGILGTLLKLLGVLMLVPGLVATIYHEPSGIVAFALASLLTLFAGVILRHFSSDEELGNKEAFAIVAIGWLLAAFFGALPFFFQGIGFIDALFESISGFSATGATILNEKNLQGYYIINSTLADNSIASVLADSITNQLGGDASRDAIFGPTYYGILFWRSFSQLIGGMGIVLLYVAILPHLGVAGRQLFKAEAVGPTKDTIAPRSKQAQFLGRIHAIRCGHDSC